MDSALPAPDDTGHLDRHEDHDADERILRRYLEHIIAKKFGSRSAAIAGLQRTRYRYIGSYQCDTVTVRLANGQQTTFFLKDFGSSQQSKDNPEERRERELRVYRDLLALTDLGTPTYYGSVWDESDRRYWLILEFVDGVVVKDWNVEHGSIAASWLARMQGYFIRVPERLRSCDYLIRHDAEYFRSKAALALRDARQIAPRIADRLAGIVERYDPIVNVMASQPLTLVHGGYIPWHIVLDPTRSPVRICPIDWELAALGPTLYDLAYFSDGAEPDAREVICDAYRQAAQEHNVPIPDRAEMRYVVDCFRLHRIFDWLSRSVEKRFPEAKMAKLVDLAEARLALLLNGPH